MLFVKKINASAFAIFGSPEYNPGNIIAVIIRRSVLPIFFGKIEHSFYVFRFGVGDARR
jgi:hypothetical protein